MSGFIQFGVTVDTGLGISGSQHGRLCSSICRLATKVTIAGGALYVACDSGLLGSSEQGSEALEKAKAAIPPAVEEWMKYFGLEVGYMQDALLLINT